MVTADNCSGGSPVALTEAFPSSGGIVSLPTIVRSVSKVLLLFLGISLLLVSFGVFTASAQDSLERRVKSKVSPAYPELARKMNLAGVVKIAVTVAPNGTIKDTKVIGGNPILVNAAVDAVKKWRFEPGSDETTGVVEFKFDPTTN